MEFSKKNLLNIDKKIDFSLQKYSILFKEFDYLNVVVDALNFSFLGSVAFGLGGFV